MITGSFLYAVISGNFRIETFSNRSEMVSHLIGAVLMGFGGVLSFGCTIGAGSDWDVYSCNWINFDTDLNYFWKCTHNENTISLAR